MINFYEDLFIRLKLFFFQCSFCSKSFLNDEFLKAHILRRHADTTGRYGNDAQLINTGMQKQNGVVTGQPNVSSNNEELLKELSQITTKLQETEARMISEREERDRKYETVRIKSWLYFDEF